MSYLIEVESLKKHFPVGGGFLRGHSVLVRAVDNVTFRMMRGMTFGLVGESGCGKTTTGRVVTALAKPTAGLVKFDGQDLFLLGDSELRDARKNFQIIFQNPFASLNPRRTVESALSQPFHIHAVGGDIPENVDKLLRMVGLTPPESFRNRFPHQLSGGQRQRVCIARAIALGPSLIVLDEPVSSLDMSIRGQILNLLRDLQGKLGLTYLLISHDMSIVRSMATTVAVMYLGIIVEQSSARELFEGPLHPYTRALLSSVPNPDPEKARTQKPMVLPGDPPSPIEIPSGCRFRTRCPFSVPACSETEPPLIDKDGGHLVACHIV